MNIKYPKFICLVACVIAFMLGGIATHHLDNLTIKNIVDANNQAQISNQIENLQILHGLKIGNEFWDLQLEILLQQNCLLF